MPERIGRIVIHNTTSDFRLVKTFSHLCGGEWTPGGWEPPAAIEPGATGGMQSESDGILTGTEGYAKYDVMEGQARLGMIYVYWDNPYFGVTHPRFATSATDIPPDCDYDSPSNSSQFSIDTSLNFTLVPISYKHTESGGDVTAPGDLLLGFVAGPVGGIATLFGLEGINKDPVWEFELRAGNFASVASSLGVSPPPASTGGHKSAGFGFVLPHDIAESPNAQGAWRYCGKCHGMFFDGFPDKGRCPAGDGHAAIGYVFVLPHDVPESPSAQGAWRYCGKCHGMYFDGYADKGHCPAGDGHAAAGFVFVLPHDVPGTPTAQDAWRYCIQCHGMFYDGFPDKGHCSGA
jgi:hypothetical protein